MNLVGRSGENDEPPVSYGFFAALEEGKRRPYCINIQSVPVSVLNAPLWKQIVTLLEKFKKSIYLIEHELHFNNAGLETYHKRIQNLIDQFDSRLEQIDREPHDLTVKNFAWGYIFRELFPIVGRSHFFQRVYFKPKGYPGDFLMMETIYRNKASGDGPLGILIDHYFLTAPAASAVRERRKVLSQLLGKYVAEILADSTKIDKIKIMNMACGSNRELFDFISHFDKTHLLECTCVDVDSDALQFTSDIVNTFEHEATVKLLHENVVKWAIKKNKPSIPKQDIIYSAGLTDYLDERLFVAFTKLCHYLLKPGGRLIVSNFSVTNPNKAWMDHIFLWKLKHRKPSDIRRLLKAAGFTNEVKIFDDPKGVNLIATTTKK